MFKSLLPDAEFRPLIERNGEHSWAEVVIGHSGVLNRLYTLKVILCAYGHCDDLGDEAAELMFFVYAYDSQDPDEEELVFGSGRETKKHFPDRYFRTKVAKLVTTLGAHLVQESMPKRLIIVAKHPDLPIVAYPKYEKLSEKILALGYGCSKYLTTDRRQLWDLSRT